MDEEQLMIGYSFLSLVVALLALLLYDSLRIRSLRGQGCYHKPSLSTASNGRYDHGQRRKLFRTNQSLLMLKFAFGGYSRVFWTGSSQLCTNATRVGVAFDSHTTRRVKCARAESLAASYRRNHSVHRMVCRNCANQMGGLAS